MTRQQAIRSRTTAALSWRQPFVMFVGCMLLAASANVYLPLPFTPVPLSLQTFCLLGFACSFSSAESLGATLLYLLVGLLGLPVFADHGVGLSTLFGATGGYLFAFPLAAGFVSYRLRNSAHLQRWQLASILFIAQTFILIAGTAYLGWFLSQSGETVGLGSLLFMGFVPFIPGELIKLALGVSLFPVIRKLFSR